MAKWNKQGWECDCGCCHWAADVQAQASIWLGEDPDDFEVDALDHDFVRLADVYCAGCRQPFEPED